ncbi:MAG: fatty acid desaturase [Candidatus Berkiellales bacterium]
MFYGLYPLPWWGYPIVLLILTHITIAAVTIFLHRYQAHRALELHPIISHFFRFWLWLTTGMETKKWAAIHRKHHAKCETVEDPHSPQILGLPLVLWQGAELYRFEAVNQETLDRYGQGTPEDWLEKHVYTQRSSWGIYSMLVIDLVLWGVPGLAIWALQMAWIPFFAAGIINGIGHYWGYRNFECPDQARNVVPWGILIGGEELHNNHHTYPTSAKLSVKWWEFDIGWLYIRTLEVFRLAKAKRRPPIPNTVSGKTQIDMETLKAIVLNRFQVMALYSKQVILPVFKQAKQTEEGQDASMWSRIKSLLIRETSLLDVSGKQKLDNFLSEHTAVNVVYQFKERLQNLWAKSSLKDSDLLEALQKWCLEAEATGINALKEFSRYLKSLTLQTA